MRRLPFVRATGAPFEVGYQHGAARGAELRAFLDDGLARIGRLAPEPVTLAALRPRLAEYSAAIAAATPRLSEEIDGLAQGAGISREEAVLLQVRREIIGYQRVPAAGDCTTYASLTAGRPAGRCWPRPWTSTATWTTRSRCWTSASTAHRDGPWCSASAACSATSG